MKKSLTRSNKTTRDLLDFPVLNEPLAPPSIRSMDEINSWIEQDYALFFDRDVYEREKQRLSVEKLFFLRD